MPITEFLARFVTDKSARETITQQIIPTDKIAWPPHRYAVIAVAANPPTNGEEPEGTNLAAMVVPENDADYGTYETFLAAHGPTIDAYRQVACPHLSETYLMWFIQESASIMDDETAEADHLMRGVVYRPCTKEELEAWITPEDMNASIVGRIQLPQQDEEVSHD